MSGTDEIESIRERKRREILSGSRSADVTDSPTTGADASEAPAEPIHVRDAEHFRELTTGHDVVLVDFYADWCGPCKMIEPIVAEIARETDAAVVKVDTDAHPDLAMDAGIQGVPTLFLYVEGEPIKRLVGVQDAATLRDLVEQYA